MTGPQRALSQGEFIALMAMMMATVAFSIDAMLPVLPEIAAELSPDAPNKSQLILTSFVMGMGLGTFFAGPISDAIGRKTTILAGFALYAFGAIVATFAPTLETLLFARLVQGLGAAGPRIVSTAMIRDLYAGRRMAQILSFVTMIFILVPAIAPFTGSLIIAAFGWRSIFVAFVGFSMIGAFWMTLRQPETLAPEHRRALAFAPLKRALVEVVSHPMVRLYIAVLSLGFAQLFAMLSSIQQLFDEVFGRGDSFPLWFMAIAIVSGSATVINARLVMRLGMRRLAIAAFSSQTVISAVLLLANSAGIVPAPLAFPLFFVWVVSVFFLAGLTFGNLNALALEPMGHIAGMAASTVGGVSTVLSVLIAVPIGLAFNGTTLPVMMGTFLCSALAWWLMRKSREADPTPRTTVPTP
ncbi:multidrug effflux MFS transporter [Oceaniglobus ichthyenteri]|uniref:multidrug effflux MFS transporter n=1 Tax=Oceaniglobus ichthyenteri TaxID=2136177 RepID=UPI000D343449|nr:multidrug effflux MFS transporter [Oceaniglobus ichthyenteri]